jgi:hypothetical protein
LIQRQIVVVLESMTSVARVHVVPQSVLTRTADP